MTTRRQTRSKRKDLGLIRWIAAYYPHDFPVDVKQIGMYPTKMDAHYAVAMWKEEHNDGVGYTTAIFKAIVVETEQ